MITPARKRLQRKNVSYSFSLWFAFVLRIDSRSGMKRSRARRLSLGKLNRVTVFQRYRCVRVRTTIVTLLLMLLAHKSYLFPYIEILFDYAHLLFRFTIRAWLNSLCLAEISACLLKVTLDSHLVLLRHTNVVALSHSGRINRCALFKQRNHHGKKRPKI